MFAFESEERSVKVFLAGATGVLGLAQIASAWKGSSQPGL